MLIDITLPITPTMIKDAQQNDNPALVGHLGTHFDVMDNTFPLAYTAHGGTFVALTYPMNCVGITGLPCRVIADV